MKTQFLKIAALLIVTAVVLGGASYLNKTAPSAIPVPQTQTGTVSLTVQDVYADKQVSVSEGETLLQALEALNAADPALALSTKDYAGMGTLVTGMGTHKNGTGGNYWQYTVNGVMPQVGADKYALHSGDAVRWIFGASQE